MDDLKRETINDLKSKSSSSRTTEKLLLMKNFEE